MLAHSKVKTSIRGFSDAGLCLGSVESPAFLAFGQGAGKDNQGLVVLGASCQGCRGTVGKGVGIRARRNRLAAYGAQGAEELGKGVVPSGIQPVRIGKVSGLPPASPMLVLRGERAPFQPYMAGTGTKGEDATGMHKPSGLATGRLAKALFG